MACARRLSRLSCGPAFLIAFSLASPAAAATYVVTNTNPSGAGSLRQAVLDANANAGVDEIDFAIPGDGVHVITPGMPAIEIDEPLLLDGFTQPGSVPNTAPPGSGFNSVIRIEVDGVLQVDAGGSFMVVRGISVQTLALSGGSNGARVNGCYINVDATGTTPLSGTLYVNNATGVQIGPGNLLLNAEIGPAAEGLTIVGNFVGLTFSGQSPIGGNGIHLSASHDVTIGGPNATDRNVISGCDAGIAADDHDLDNLRILGNFIGTDVTGTRPVGNGTGIDLEPLVVAEGFLYTIAGNVIGGNQSGIRLNNVSLDQSVIQGNFFGTDQTESLDLGNGCAIYASDAGVVVGGVGPGEANVFAHNHNLNGVFGVIDVLGTSSLAMRGNRFFANDGLDIDLGFDGVTLNDPGDGDSGPNQLQNFPVVTSVVPGAGSTHIAGMLNTDAVFSNTYVIDLYSAPACLGRPRGPIAGAIYLGSQTVVTDGQGNATFSLDVPVVLAADDVVTATTTWLNPACAECGYTSEFLQRIVFDVDPPSGPAGQTTAVTLDGMLFEDGATVTVGGVGAADVVVTSPTTITATMPAFPAGTLHDVEVTLPTGTRNTLPNGWLTDFTDMPPDNPFHDAVLRLVGNGIAVGVGVGQYGAANATLREQMAVFLLKGEHGQCFAPTACAHLFDDVPCDNPFAPFVEALAGEQVTAGCGGGDYCPIDPVRREQMAVFLLKTRHGFYYVPPACGGRFTDVPCPSQYADWIEELAFENITAGCGDGTTFCPADPVTRAQMAVFIGKTFRLP